MISKQGKLIRNPQNNWLCFFLRKIFEKIFSETLKNDLYYTLHFNKNARQDLHKCTNQDYHQLQYLPILKIMWMYKNCIAVCMG